MEKDIYIKREKYHKLLDDALKSKQNVALLGKRKCGKTSIIKNYIENVPNSVYLDFEKLSINPENFAIEFVGKILFKHLKAKSEDYNKFLSIDYLNSLDVSENVSKLIKTIDNELLKIKPDQKLIVKSAFKLANELSLVLFIDNFENILEMNNFSQIDDILGLIEFKNFVITSSSIREFISLKGFNCYEIDNFNKKECLELVKDEKISDKIWKLSNGSPHIIKILSKYSTDLKEEFISELLNGSISEHCDSTLRYYSNKARGQALLKTILKVVAKEPLRLSEIARRVYRSAPVTKSILERLIEADLIYKKDNRFYFSDPILGLWLKVYECSDFESNDLLKEVDKLI